MSSLLALQTKDTIIFASDTALSTNIKGKSYRVSNNENKLFNYPDFIMFASGKKYLRDLFISNLSISPSLNEIENILSNHITPISEEFSLEIVIAMKDLSKLVFYSSTNDFIRSESLPNNYINLYTAGYMTNQIADKFEEYYPKYTVYDSLKKIYKEISCDEIGGSLDIFKLDTNGLSIDKFNIDNKREYRDVELIKLLDLVHAERIVGRLILSNKLIIDSLSGIMTLEDGLLTIKDASMIDRVQLGRYQDPKNPNNYKYGLNILNGQFNINTTSNPNRGVQFDDEGIRGFNSNGVKTFEFNTNGQATLIGSLSIKSSHDSQKGVIFDGNGLRGYKSNGALAFEIDNNGNAWFAGRLVWATGSVQDLTGTIDDMGGTFKGTLRAADGIFTGSLQAVNGTFTGTLQGVDGTFSGTLQAARGTFDGVVTGTLSAQTINSIKIDTSQINTGSLNAVTIDVSQLRANGASVQNLSAISSNLGRITSGQIDITDDLRVGNNIYLGSSDASGQKRIIFNQGARITAGGGSFGADMTISANVLNLRGDTIKVVGDTIDFSGVNVIGL